MGGARQRNGQRGSLHVSPFSYKYMQYYHILHTQVHTVLLLRYIRNHIPAPWAHLGGGDALLDAPEELGLIARHAAGTQSREGKEEMGRNKKPRTRTGRSHETRHAFSRSPRATRDGGNCLSTPILLCQQGTRDRKSVV